jgi:hypothetical protein
MANRKICDRKVITVNRDEWVLRFYFRGTYYYFFECYGMYGFYSMEDAKDLEKSLKEFNILRITEEEADRLMSSKFTEIDIEGYEVEVEKARYSLLKQEGYYA